MKRILHNLIQGSEEWQQFRLEHDGASEAAAMLGLSKKTTRGELLRMKHTGLTKEFSDWVQKNILDRGHEIEALARPLVEKIIGEDLYPVTYSYGRKSASCDGLTMDGETAFEHKQWNADLAASVARGELPEEHQPQCQQIMDVTGANRVIFTVSDGTPENLVWMEVSQDANWVARIDAGWAQFRRDLAEYIPQEIIPAAVAAPQMQLPSVSVQVIGSIEVRDNLAAFGDALRAYVERINRQPETDQDFADLEATVKTLKEAETALDAAENGALGQAASIDQMRRIVGESRELARTTRLTIEKLVDAEKKNRREKIVSDAKDAIRKFVAELNARVKFMPEIPADFAGVIKGKKTLASIKNATDTELARAKCDASQTADMIDANLKVYGELASGYEASFADLGKIVNQQPEACRAIIEQRIAQQKSQEEARRAAEEERIRAEERAKVGREQAEQRRISGLWVEAMLAALSDVSAPVQQFGANSSINTADEARKNERASAMLETVSAVSIPVPTVNPAWQSARDEVVSMLEDMSISELALARIALAKIRNERQARAA